MAVALVAVAAPAASAAPWPCDNAGYVVQEDPTTTGGQLWFQRVDRQPNGTYALTRLGTLPGTSTLNALAFRVQDGFMYAWNLDSGEIMQVGRDAAGNATFSSIGAPIGAPAGFSTVVGTMLDNGHYLVYGNSAATGVVALEIDVTASPAPTVVRTLTPTFDTGEFSIADWAVNPVDGRLYTELTRISTGTGEVREIVLSGTQLSIGAKVADTPRGAGAIWFSPQSEGLMIAYEANTHLVSIDIATGQEAQLGDAPDVANVDGTACANTLAVSKNAAPRTAIAGTELTYTYTITSRGIGSSPVDFADTLPSGMTYVPGGVTVTGPLAVTNAYGGTDTLTLAGTMARNQTATITARVMVSPDHPCNVDVDNQAQATMRAPGLPAVTIISDDPTTASNPEDATRVHVNCSADVDIVKSASPTPAVPGTNETYSLKVTNHGPSTARNVRVSDPLPKALTFVSASAGCAEVNKTVTCTATQIAAGASQTFTVTAKIASSAKDCADVRNTATVTNDVADPDVTNNKSSVCPTIEARSDLRMSKVAAQGEVPSGGQIMYTLVVKNNGPSDDSGVKITDPMAQGLSLVSAKPSQGSCSTASGQVDCSLGTVQAGGSVQVLVTAQVTALSGPSCATSSVTNTATATGDAKDANPDNNKASATICVVPGPNPKFDLSITKTASSKSVYVGQPLEYTVTVTNKGPEIAPNAKITDTLNAPASVVSVKASQGSCTKTLPLTCQLGTIPAGGKVTITVTVKLRESGCKRRNAASATGDGTDVDPADNLARVDVCAKRVPLRLTKVADSASVRAGDEIGYTIRVSNPTAGEAKDVDVCDRLPSGMVYVSSQSRPKYTKGRYCWHIDTLKAHKSRSYRIRVRLLSSASGDKVNRATASGKGARTKHAKDPVHVLPARASGGGVTG